MKKVFVILIFIYSALITKAQYPFEQFDSIKYQSFNNWKIYDQTENKNTIHLTLTIVGFYKNKDSLTIQLSSFNNHWDSSYIRIYRNKKQIQKIFEPMSFTGNNIWGPLILADFNGDSLKDIKINAAYMGCGLASMNTRIIYLFQMIDGSFKKCSFTDKLEYGNRVERDFNKDGNFEIITMTLNGFEGHNYWTFDLFDYENGTLLNVDDEFEYPIMIQFLFRENFEITNKISKEKMKEFKLNVPEDFDIE